MRSDRTALIALCVIEDVLERCRAGDTATPPAHALRLALAYLYQVAGDDLGVGPRSRDPFDELWQLVTKPADVSSSRGLAAGGYTRSSYADTQYARIRRMVRIPQTIEMQDVMLRLRGVR